MGPLWPYLVLIAIPAAGFILPDLIGGHLLMTGDNLQQNYPLHVLTGSMERHGQLPLWDQYIFSGSPLLAGFNAGAFYPLTALFVILPDRAAWIGTEVVLFSAIGIGMYVFLRDAALSTTACLLGAITFAFSGTVASQVNHLDMTEGFVAIPWMLLAVRHTIRDAKWRWAIMLGVGFALVILGGAPEAMLDEAWLVVLFAAFSAGFNRAHWWRVVSRGAAGAALALSLAAIQWLPGLDAIANSQRSGFGSDFAATGSYPPRDLMTSLMPYLYGGYGHLGESTFFSSYNLPEVGIYLGILPIIAMLVMWIPRLALAAQFTRPVDLVPARGSGPAARARGQHAARAPLQCATALRSPTLAEPQHDRGVGGLVSLVRRLDRSRSCVGDRWRTEGTTR